MSWISNATGRDGRRERTAVQRSATDAKYGTPTDLFRQSWGDEATRGAGYDAQAGQDRNRFLAALQGAPETLNSYAQNAMAAAMPALQGQLQGARESAIRRGISTGDLGTSYEGDIISATQRNVAQSVAGQGMNVLNAQLGGYGGMSQQSSALGEGSRNRYLDLISGQLDRDTAGKNARNARNASYLNAGAQVVGSGIGALAMA